MKFRCGLAVQNLFESSRPVYSENVVIKISGEATKEVGSFGKKAKATGAKIGTSIKSTFSWVGNRFRRTDKTIASEKPEYDDTTKKQEQPKPETVDQCRAEPGNRKAPIQSFQEPHRSAPKTDESPADPSAPAESRTSEDVELECFTCENLIHCEIRNSPARLKEKRPCSTAR